MDRPILDIGNSANWEEVYPVISHSAVQTSPRGYMPIPEIVIPLLLESNILAVLVTSTTALLYQSYAGVLLKTVRTGIQPGGNADTQAQEARKIFLNRITLVRFEPLSPTYQLSFKPSWKLSQVNFFCWKYTGTVLGSVDESLLSIGKQLESIPPIGRQLLRTDEKVNQIVTYLRDGNTPRTELFNDPFNFL